MKRRWFSYILIGIAFGIFDYYYQVWATNTLLRWQVGSLAEQIAWFVLILGVWLLLVIPVVLSEAKRSRSPWLAALAGSVTWLTSVIAYYLYNAFDLLVIGVAGRPEMHFTNHADPYFWVNWQGVLAYSLLRDNLLWAAIAVFGGGLIGLLLGALYLRWTRAGASVRAATAAGR